MNRLAFKTIRFAALTGALVVFFTFTAAAAPPVKLQLASEIKVLDVHGQIKQPFLNSGQKAVVLFFITVECPITNSYAPEMERIRKTYEPKGIRTYYIYVDGSIPMGKAAEHVKEFGLGGAALYDSKHSVVNYCGASVTPEAAIILPDGSEAYRGRIDDKYIDFGKSRDHAQTHDLRNAIDAVIAGKAVPKSRTRAIGCYIP